MFRQSEKIKSGRFYCNAYDIIKQHLRILRRLLKLETNFHIGEILFIMLGRHFVGCRASLYQRNYSCSNYYLACLHRNSRSLQKIFYQWFANEK